jgi:hypothetical protein
MSAHARPAQECGPKYRGKLCLSRSGQPHQASNAGPASDDECASEPTRIHECVRVRRLVGGRRAWPMHAPSGDSCTARAASGGPRAAGTTRVARFDPTSGPTRFAFTPTRDGWYQSPWPSLRVTGRLAPRWHSVERGGTRARWATTKFRGSHIALGVRGCARPRDSGAQSRRPRRSRPACTTPTACARRALTP